MKTKLLILSLLSMCCLSAYCQWTNIRIEEQTSPKNDIRTICFDPSENLFVATANGIYKQQNEQWISDSPEGVYIESFNIDSQGLKRTGVWGGGLYKAEPNQDWNKDENTSISMSAHVIHNDQNGNTWIGTWNKGLVKVDIIGDTLVYNTQNALLGDNSVLSIAEDEKNNTLWVGTYHGVSCLNNGNWTLYDRDNSPLPNNDVYSLVVDNDGIVWIGTCGGVVQFDGKEWISYNTQNSDIPSNIILSLAVDENNTLWMGTAKGLVAKNGDNVQVYNTANSNLINNRIQTITVKGDKLYAGTNLGLSVADISKVSDLFIDHPSIIVIESYHFETQH